MSKRVLGLDLLKIIATVFVVVLHVNGYLLDIKLNMFSETASLAWHVREAAAYPAIHLFVMISACFLLNTKNSQLKRIRKIWCQTLAVCLLGLLICLILGIKCNNEIKSLISCFAPFLGRAYWYVSDFIILLLFVPSLNVFIEKVDRRLFRYTLIVLFMVMSMFPTVFSMFNWKQDYSNIGLFVFLYMLTAYVKDYKPMSKIGGGRIWFLSTSLLVISWFIISHVNFLPDEKSMILYQYCSPLVVLEALGLFLVFYNINTRHSSILISFLSNASLCVYLIHMHPIIKTYYVEWEILGWINTQNCIQMIVQMMLVEAIVYFAGVIISILVKQIGKWTDNYVLSSLIRIGSKKKNVRFK